MAHIGSFRKVGAAFAGGIAALEGPRIVRASPDTGRSGENPPSRLVLAGRVKIGAVWRKPAPSPERRDYSSVKTDDPSLREPIQANLYADDRGETWNLIWTCAYPAEDGRLTVQAQPRALRAGPSARRSWVMSKRHRAMRRAGRGGA